jgi:hypothetical protein
MQFSAIFYIFLHLDDLKYFRLEGPYVALKLVQFSYLTVNDNLFVVSFDVLDLDFCVKCMFQQTVLEPTNAQFRNIPGPQCRLGPAEYHSAV